MLSAICSRLSAACDQVAWAQEQLSFTDQAPTPSARGGWRRQNNNNNIPRARHAPHPHPSRLGPCTGFSPHFHNGSELMQVIQGDAVHVGCVVAITV